MAGEFLRSGKPGEPTTPLTRLGGGLDKVAKLKFVADEKQAERSLGAAETGARVAGAESRANIARHRKLKLELAKLGRKEKGDLEKYILSNMGDYLDDESGTGRGYHDAVKKLDAALKDTDKPGLFTGDYTAEEMQNSEEIQNLRNDVIAHEEAARRELARRFLAYTGRGGSPSGDIIVSRN